MDSIKISKIHFIGVGGISMSALCTYFLKKGFSVSGSDCFENSLIRKLKKSGVKIHIGHNENILKGVDTVVYTSAIGDDNPELKYAKSNGLKIFKRSEILGYILEEYKESIAISGSHGKTTTTAMLSNVLIKANCDPTVFLGGEEKSYGNYRKGNSEFLVVEACEFKKNFLNLFPKIAVVLNVDDDHADSFVDDNDRIETFKKFIAGRVSFINADDVGSSSLFGVCSFRFGINNNAEYVAKKIVQDNNGKYSFNVYAFNKNLGRINLSIKGRHNIYNALAVIGVCNYYGIPFDLIKKGIQDFSGVKRRNESIGKIYGLKCICDYAHHPTEIKAMINSLNKTKKTLIVFQPHTYSRTKHLMDKFIESLSGENPVIIYKTYPAREKFDKYGSAKTLFYNMKAKGKQNVLYAENPETLKDEIKELSFETDKILVLGAGDIYDIVKKIYISTKNNKKV